MARPLYTAFAPLSRATSVTVENPGPVAPTPGLQPSIVPFSVSKMNRARPELPLASVTTKSFGFVSVLNTCPVGAAPVTPTVRPTLLTLVAVPLLYSVVMSEPLSDTHNGEPGVLLVPGDADRPQALTRAGSVSGAWPG